MTCKYLFGSGIKAGHTAAALFLSSISLYFSEQAYSSNEKLNDTYNFTQRNPIYYNARQLSMNEAEVDIIQELERGAKEDELLCLMTLGSWHATGDIGIQINGHTEIIERMVRGLRYQERDPAKGAYYFERAHELLKRFDCLYKWQEFINPLPKETIHSPITGLPVNSTGYKIFCKYVAQVVYVGYPGNYALRQPSPEVLIPACRNLGAFMLDLDVTGVSAFASYDKAILHLGNNALMWRLPVLLGKSLHCKAPLDYEFWKKSGPLHVFHSMAMSNGDAKQELLKVLPLNYNLGKLILQQLCHRPLLNEDDRMIGICAKVILNLDHYNREICKLLFAEHCKPEDQRVRIMDPEHEVPFTMGRQGFLRAFIDQVDLEALCCPFKFQPIEEIAAYIIGRDLAEGNWIREAIQIDNRTELLTAAEIKEYIYHSISRRIRLTVGECSAKIQGRPVNEIMDIFMAPTRSNESFPISFFNKVCWENADLFLPAPLSQFEAARAYEVAINLDEE